MVNKWIRDAMMTVEDIDDALLKNLPRRDRREIKRILKKDQNYAQALEKAARYIEERDPQIANYLYDQATTYYRLELQRRKLRAERLERISLGEKKRELEEAKRNLDIE